MLTDPSVCFLYDARTRQTRLDLFEVASNKLLQMNERLVTSARSSDFITHVLAHHTLITVDERFPGLVCREKYVLLILLEQFKLYFRKVRAVDKFGVVKFDLLKIDLLKIDLLSIDLLSFCYCCGMKMK